MTTAPVSAGKPARARIPTARIAGLLYLGLCVAGFVGYFLIRGQLFDADHPAATLGRLASHEMLARLGIATELAVVLCQALLALWLYRLFLAIDAFLASAMAAFGLVNAMAILASSALLATALDLALQAPRGHAAGTVQAMYIVSGHLWGVGGLFFGLWLIPMGALVLRSRWMPPPMGWILVAGGVGYVINTFVMYLAPTLAPASGLLAWIAAVGEFWMVGYLLARGARIPVPDVPPYSGGRVIDRN